MNSFCLPPGRSCLYTHKGPDMLNPWGTTMLGIRVIASSGRFLIPLTLAAISVLPLYPQQTKLPNADEVKALQSKFRQERDQVIKTGAAKRFLPILLDKAEEFGKRADAALDGGRLLQASELFRQARWQLPYQPAQVPERVSRILGNLRLRHGQEINDVAFSPDGRRLATSSKDRTVKIWDMENGHELLTYKGHRDHVRALAFSPDGKAIASAGAEADIKIWDPLTGNDVRTIKGKGTYVTSLTYSPDGKYVVASNDDRAVRLYETANGNLKREIVDFRLIVLKVAFNPAGNILGIGVGDGSIHLYEYPKMVENLSQPFYWAKQDLSGTATKNLVFSPDSRTMVRCGDEGLKLYNTPLPGEGLQVNNHRLLISRPNDKAKFNCAIFSRDGKTLFTGGQDGIIRLWNPETGQPTGTFKGHNGEIKALAFNATGSQLASASTDYTVRLWNFDIVLQARDFTGHQGSVWNANFSPEGQRIVSASSDKSVKIWEVAGAKVVHSLPGHDIGATVAIFSPDGKIVASGGGDKLLRLWNADTGAPLATGKGHEGTVTAIDFSRAGKHIVTGGSDNRIKVWDLAGKEVMSISTPSVVTTVLFSPKGNQIASAHVDQQIRLWDLKGKNQQSWTAHGIAVTGLAYSPNGQWLASCGADHLVKVWSLTAPGSNPILLTGHTGPLSSVAFRKDNQHLVSCGSDLIVKLWKLEGNTGKEAQNYRGHTDWVTSVAFSKDGYYVVSASVDRTLKIWEITSREIPLAAEHTGAVQAVAVSPDGKLIASGGTDKSIKLWDRETGLEKLTLTGHDKDILSLAFTPDSKTLVSSSEDSTLRLWNVQTGLEMLPRKPTFINLINPVPFLTVPDDKHLLAWVPGNARYTTVTAWDLATGNEVVTFIDPEQDKKKRNRQVQAVAFTPKGDRIATGGKDSDPKSPIKDASVRIFAVDFDKKTAKPLFEDDWYIFKTDKGEERPPGMGDIAFTSDGKILVVGNDRGDIAVCQIEGRKVLTTLKGHKQKIAVCITSPDGKRIATAGYDNVVKLWDIASGKELRSWDMRMSVQERTSFVMNLAFTPDGRQLITANANTTLFVLDLP